MNKPFLTFLGGICTGIFLIMLYLHRNVIKAAVTGEEMLKAPKSCPAFRAKDDE